MTVDDSLIFGIIGIIWLRVIVIIGIRNLSGLEAASFSFGWRLFSKSCDDGFVWVALGYADKDIIKQCVSGYALRVLALCLSGLDTGYGLGFPGIDATPTSGGIGFGNAG